MAGTAAPLLPPATILTLAEQDGCHLVFMSLEGSDYNYGARVVFLQTSNFHRCFPSTTTPYTLDFKSCIF